MEFDAFLDLLPDALLWLAIRRVKGSVTAEGAATSADLAVTVGTAESSVDADFLDAGTELLHEVVAVGVETSSVEEGRDHEAKIRFLGITLLREVIPAARHGGPALVGSMLGGAQPMAFFMGVGRP